MASIGEDGGGRKRILFVAGRQRKTIRLGKCSMAKALEFKGHVEALIAAQITGGAPDDEASKWVVGLHDTLHERLAAVGLVKARQRKGAATLGLFLDAYIAGRTDVKPNTLIGLGQARRNLLAFFKPTKALADITAGDAEEYWRYLIGDKASGGVGLAQNTARRLCGRAKQFFRFAVRKGLVRENVFIELESNVRSNPERQFFITRDVADKVMAACPDAQWRLLFALSRYGGLRCPSEHLALKWTDIVWGDVDTVAKVRVPSCKTEHIEGRAFRWMPLFPELRGPLLEVFAEAEPGAEYVITRYRASNANLRTHFKRIIQRAGLSAWPKLFQNLRATRETELAEHYPAHVVCAWLGNTQAVAQAHYLQVTDAHFADAAKEPAATLPDNKADGVAVPGGAQAQTTDVGRNDTRENLQRAVASNRPKTAQAKNALSDSDKADFGRLGGSGGCFPISSKTEGKGVEGENGHQQAGGVSVPDSVPLDNAIQSAAQKTAQYGAVPQCTDRVERGENSVLRAETKENDLVQSCHWPLSESNRYALTGDGF